MNIPELLQELNIEYKEHGQHHHCSPGWIQADCPFCSPNSQHFRLGIHLEWGNANCWSCGSHRLAEVLKEITGQSQAHLLKGLTREHPYDPTTRKTPSNLLKTPLGLAELLPAHRRYLTNRGLDPDAMVRLWGIQGIGLHPKLAWRIFIPIFYQGKMVSWTTRSISNTATRRYINAARDEEAISAKTLLFGSDYTRHSVVVCEGPLDAMAIGPGAVATMGVAYSQEQLAKIAKYPSRVICFDAEPMAQQRARQLLETLCVLPGQTINIRLESGKDAAEADKSEIAELRRRYLE